ncbi:hypothetical protein GCM10008949_44990 [Deinococcus humi]|nr:hypothetical protein GCM10008949_44990 [Deinococcus humi]
MVYAHGGLVSEAVGNSIIDTIEQRLFANAPNICHVSFLNRTGLFETLDQLSNSRAFTWLARAVTSVLSALQDASALPEHDGSPEVREDASQVAVKRARELHGRLQSRSLTDSIVDEVANKLLQLPEPQVAAALLEVARAVQRRAAARVVVKGRVRRDSASPVPASRNEFDAYLVEEVVRRFQLPPVSAWREMKRRVHAAFAPPHPGAAIVASVQRVRHIQPDARVSLIGHSLGGIWVEAYLACAGETGNDLHVDTVALLAPANSLASFRRVHRWQGTVWTQALLMGLTDAEEREEIDELSPLLGTLYPRTLLYLISNALEDQPAFPILGMQKFWEAPVPHDVHDLFQQVSWVPGIVDGQVIEQYSHGGFSTNPQVLAWLASRLVDS